MSMSIEARPQVVSVEACDTQVFVSAGQLVPVYVGGSSIPTVSGVTACDGVSAITLNYDIMRLVSSGGYVLHQAAPSFILPDDVYDGQIFRLQGYSETNYIEIQDATQLPGSKVHLQFRQNMRLGLNDMLVLYYDAVQDLLIEDHRVDNY
jgi:hypothetical protein